jgi:hypothetical protein
MTCFATHRASSTDQTTQGKWIEVHSSTHWAVNMSTARWGDCWTSSRVHMLSHHIHALVLHTVSRTTHMLSHCTHALAQHTCSRTTHLFVPCTHAFALPQTTRIGFLYETYFLRSPRPRTYRPAGGAGEGVGVLPGGTCRQSVRREGCSNA